MKEELYHFINQLKLTVRLLQAEQKYSMATYLQGQIAVLDRIGRGASYILCTYYFPSEAASLFDMNFIYIERIVGLAISLNMLKSDGQTPLPYDICSYQKAFVQILERRLLPIPEAVIAVKYPCRDGVTLCEYIHDAYQVPIFYIDIQNLEQDLRTIYFYLKDHYGIKNEISAVVEKSNTANKIKNEIDSYRICYPGILPSGDFLKLFPVENDFGSDTAIEVLKELLNTLKKNIKGYAFQLKWKIFWMGLIPLYNNNMLSKAEARFSCKFVYEEMWMYGCSELSEETFFKDLARKIQTSFFYDVNKRVKRIAEMVEKMGVHIVINFSQKNCSFLPQSIPIFKDYFMKKNVGFYNLGCDVVSGHFHTEQLFSVIEKAIAGGF